MDKFIKYIPACLFAAYFAKVGVLGATYVDAAVLAVAGLLFIALEYKTNDKKIQTLEEQISLLRAELEANKKEISELRSYVTTQKMNTLRMTK